ncbi:MAG: IS3 family transposase [Intestinimonas sp.]|uniref:IS3 family transposase n=1 Tax=Intestinimonas sp. TaxID=1965293 RepID=UPI002A91AB34|nr:IS3 family transposase [Intestinimonas sp.]MDY5337950.1 IS3 family transposase [Intestinimonas sp.]
MKQVQQIFDDSSQRYGAGKIRIILAENGIHTSRKRISTIMQELDLRSVRTDSVQETAEIPVMSRVPEYDEPRLSNIYVEKRGSFRGLSVPS